VVVYWGDQRSGLVGRLDQFYSRITRSTYFDPLAEYSLPQKPIGKAKYVSSTQIMPGDTRTLDTLEISREIDRHILRGVLPFPTDHTIYIVHFGASTPTVMGANILGIPVGAPPGGNPGYCAYHITARTQVPTPIPGIFVYGPKIRIAVIPDQIAASCATTTTLFDRTTFSATHELVETITNPDSVIVEMAPVNAAMIQCNGIFIPASAAVPLPPVGGAPLQPIFNGLERWSWTSNKSVLCNPDEVADQCRVGTPFQTTKTTNGTYSVSQYHLNSLGRCAVSSVQGTVPTPPPPRQPTAYEVCLDSCSSELEGCMADAHSGAARGACVRESKTCRKQCAP
jgi:hypothetical protein